MNIFLVIIAVFFTANAPITVNKSNISVTTKISDSSIIIPANFNKFVATKEAPVIINKYFSQQEAIMPWERSSKSVDLVADVHVC